MNPSFILTLKEYSTQFKKLLEIGDVFALNKNVLGDINDDEFMIVFGELFTPEHLRDNYTLILETLKKNKIGHIQCFQNFDIHDPINSAVNITCLEWNPSKTI